MLIVSGPSGSGKSTLVEKILEVPGTLLLCFVYHSVAAQDGERRQVVQFCHLKVSSSRWSSAVNFWNTLRCLARTGTALRSKWLEKAQAGKQDLVLEIDVQGALQVKRQTARARWLFLYCLLRARISNGAFGRAGRIPKTKSIGGSNRARQEMLNYSSYDFAIINDDLERAGREVQAIALGSRCQVAPNEERIREILKSFGG